MTGPNVRPLHCWFCGVASGDVELLFVSSRGGLPPIICSGCVEGFAAVLAAHRSGCRGACGCRAQCSGQGAAGWRATAERPIEAAPRGSSTNMAEAPLSQPMMPQGPTVVAENGMPYCRAPIWQSFCQYPAPAAWGGPRGMGRPVVSMQQCYRGAAYCPAGAPESVSAALALL